jgi:hypothetical protein
VGLARYQRRRSLIPPWLEERFGTIIVSAAVLSVILWALFHTSKVNVPTAHLLIASGPTRIWLENESHELRSIQMSIRNTGSVDAQGVIVTLSIADKSYQLSGPTSLAAGEIGTYEGIHEAFVTAPDPLEAAATCQNCT